MIPLVPTIAPEALLMFAIGGLLIYLAIAKEYEPTLLLPIGFGVLLGNLPNSPMNQPEGMLHLLIEFGIDTELFPLFIFIGIGAMMDFRPLLSQPMFALLGAAGQLGIFATLILATLVGFPLNQAASIAVIGAIDGPTSIYVSSLLAPELLAPIAVTAYSYMSLVPIIQPPLMRLFTTRAERRIRMEYAPRPVPRGAVIAFPIVVTIGIGILVPPSAPLVATLKFGNLLKESGVVAQLAQHRVERARQPVDDLPGPHRRQPHAGRDVPAADDPVHPRPRALRVRPRHHRGHPVRQGAVHGEPRQGQPPSSAPPASAPSP